MIFSVCRPKRFGQQIIWMATSAIQSDCAKLSRHMVV
jgi:hypothetical protein